MYAEKLLDSVTIRPPAAQTFWGTARRTRAMRYLALATDYDGGGCASASLADSEVSQEREGQNYLADQVEQFEQRQDLEPAETRSLIRGLIEARYTLPT